MHDSPSFHRSLSLFVADRWYEYPDLNGTWIEFEPRPDPDNNINGAGVWDSSQAIAYRSLGFIVRAPLRFRFCLYPNPQRS